MSNDAPLIAVHDVSHRYQRSGRPALSGVSLTVNRGACLGLLGPNGAGKSTLIDLINGVMPVQRGEIRIEGQPVRRNAGAQRKISAYAPQDLAFYPQLTVAENLGFFAAASGLHGVQSREPIRESVGICNLGDCLGKRAGQLSGGQKRRLNLAIALLGGPSVLFLDEPTVGVDAVSRSQIIEAISTLNRRGVTIIYTSHYMEEVEQLCSEIVIIHQGRVRLSARMADLKVAAGNRARILFAAPLGAAALDRFRAIGAQAEGPRQIRPAIAGPAALAELLTLAGKLELEIDQVAYGARRLDDVYLEATSGAEPEPEPA